MGKKSRKSGRDASDSLSGKFGSAGAKPPMSKYAKKKAAARIQDREEYSSRNPFEVRITSSAPFEKASVPAKPDGFHISAQLRNSTTAMVTGSYSGGAGVPAIFASVPMPPLSDAALAAKPCFMVADKRNGEWQITRYVGDLSQDGMFKGAQDTISVGLASDHRLQRTIFSALISWAQSHGTGKLDRLPQQVFGVAQKIHGLDPKPSRGPRSAR